MKFTSLILSFLFCANAVSSQNAINSITRNERLHNEISDHIVIESKGFGPWGLETSLLWRKADTLFGKLQLSKAINYFYDSSYTIKYYTFLRILLLDDDVALRLLTSIITDSTKIHWHFDDEMGSEKFNQLLAHEYKIFIQLKYHNGGKLSGTDSHYFGTGIYYFPKSNEKLWNKKYTKFLKLVTPHGLQNFVQVWLDKQTSANTKPGIGYGRTQQHWALVLNFNISFSISSGCGRTNNKFHTCTKPCSL